MDELFITAHSKLYYPVLAKFKSIDLPKKVPFQIAFSVPKRRIKTAVKRNLIKRRMLEAFRKNQHILSPTTVMAQQQMAIIFIYISNDILPLTDIEKVVVKQLEYIREKTKEIAK